MSTPHHRLSTGALGLGLALALSAAAHAQGVYRVVTPDGKVTFTDQPPAQGSTAPVTAGPASGASADNAGLPAALRAAVSRFPVTLYTSSGCGPCEGGRALLRTRGVPFTEKTVNRNEDIEALQKISGANSLPYLTIGQQGLKGFSESEWTQYLDAAGYPRQSALPRNYRAPAASPLTEPPAAPTAAPSDAAATRDPRPAPPAPSPAPAVNPANPTGIRF
jgi:glutaredoxin